MQDTKSPSPVAYREEICHLYQKQLLADIDSKSYIFFHSRTDLALLILVGNLFCNKMIIFSLSHKQ